MKYFIDYFTIFYYCDNCLSIQVFEGFPDADNNETERHISTCHEEEEVLIEIDVLYYLDSYSLAMLTHTSMSLMNMRC